MKQQGTEMEGRTGMMIRSLFTLLLATTALSACGGTASQSSSTGGGLIEARDKLVSDLLQCTQTHGFDPQNAVGVAENALAPNELPWRQCAYDAVRAYGRSHPTLRSMYDQLVAEDLAMTTAIQQGTMTRSQRRARIEDLVAQIKAAEEQQIEAAASEQARQNDQLRNVVDNFRGFSY
jgi:hypothetical protein